MTTAVLIPQGKGAVPGPTKQDRDRQADQKAAWAAYRGDFKPPFQVRPDEPDFNVLPNRCGPIVNSGMYFLFGHGVQFEVAEDAPAGAAEALDACWGDEDDKNVFCQKLAINGAVNGSVFVQIIPPVAGQRDQDSDDRARFIILDPQTVSVRTDPDDCESVRMFILEYESQDEAGQTIIRRKVFERASPEEETPYGPTLAPEQHVTWTLTSYVSQTTMYGFVQDGPTLNWPFPFAPIQHCQNLPNPNEFWGLPDLTKSIVSMNESLCFVESNTAKIIYHHAHPWGWFKTNNPQQTPIHIEPGKLVPIPLNSDIGAVQAHGDIANSRAFAADLRADMDEDSGINSVVLGRMSELPRGTISGITIKMLYQPVTQKTISKRRTYGKLLRKLCQIHLYFAGLDPDGDTIPVSLHWQDPLPVDDVAIWQSAPLQEQMGVSKRTILSERGYDYDEELERSRAEAQDDQASYDMGQGQAPEAQQFGKQAMPPEMGAMQQAMQQAAGNAQEGEES